MPQLPSGLHFALDPSPLQEIMKNAQGGLKVHELMALESVNHLFSHINVLYFRESTGGPALALSEHSVVLPSNLEAYPSGFNLISIKSEFQKWSIEDQKAFKAFLNEKRTNDYLGGLLESVVRKQNLLHPEGCCAATGEIGR
jgi:hypothetical protein